MTEEEFFKRVKRKRVKEVSVAISAPKKNGAEGLISSHKNPETILKILALDVTMPSVKPINDLSKYKT